MPALPSRPPSSVLRRVFGYASFRGQQQEIVEHVVAGGDAIVLMPTGGGKSLCYQLPALLRPGLGVVVSPLIALMKDQVDALRQAGVRAAALNSGLPAGEAAAVERAVRDGALDLLYVVARAADDAALPRPAAAVPRSRCSRSTRRIASRNGATISAANTRRSASCKRALSRRAADRADRDRRRPDPPRHRRAAASRTARRSSPPATTGRTCSTGSSPSTSPRDELLRFLDDEHPGDAGIVYCLTRRAVEETAAWLSAARPRGAALPCRPRPPRRARATRTASCARKASSSSRRSPSAWASTSPMSASSRISTRRRTSKPITRRPAAPGATGCRPMPG